MTKIIIGLEYYFPYGLDQDVKKRLLDRLDYEIEAACVEAGGTMKTGVISIVEVEDEEAKAS